MKKNKKEIQGQNLELCESRTETLPIARLQGSSWNTHQIVKGNDDFNGLAESIKENGIICRISVRQMIGNYYEIIDGHRRVEAAKSIGLNEVPCEIYEEISDEKAQAMTLTANVQRLENDPILESACIKLMAESGKTIEKIAAALGKSVCYVSRRSRLCNLTDQWKKWLVKNEADVWLMEYVAAHEQKLQDECFNDLDIESDGSVDEDDILRTFRSYMRSLKDCKGFDCEKAGCKNCGYNTANHGLLFPDDDWFKGGRCENAECFIRNWNVETDRKIEMFRKSKVSIIEVDALWKIPNSWEVESEKNSKKGLTQAYVFTERQLKTLVWGHPKEKSETSKKAMTETEKAEQKALKKEHSVWAKNRREGFDQIRDTLHEDPAKWARSIVSQPLFVEVMQKKYEKMIGVYVNDFEAMEIFDIVGALELGLSEDQIKALTSGDPLMRHVNNAQEED